MLQSGKYIQQSQGNIRQLFQSDPLIRVPLYEPGGREFESLRARQLTHGYDELTGSWRHL